MKRLAATVSFPILLAAFTLTACGGEPSAASPAGTPSAPSPAAASASAPASAAASEPPASAAASAAAPSEPAEPTAAAAAEPDAAAAAQPTYRMNKNYDIVPIDPVSTERKVVLLTFDDGPKAEATLKPILDTLDKHHAKAIFFVNGYRVKAHPELLKEIDERGQTVGNHSWDHIKLGQEKPDKIKEQIGQVQDIVKATIGKTPVFFRPPFASGNADVHAIAKANGLLYMTWSNGSLDWEMTGTKIKDKTAALIKNVTDQLHPGSNILMHELAWTGDGLDALLTTLEGKGYGFVDPAAIDPTPNAQ